jgi:hypothetical protein
MSSLRYSIGVGTLKIRLKEMSIISKWVKSTRRKKPGGGSIPVKGHSQKFRVGKGSRKKKK